MARQRIFITQRIPDENVEELRRHFDVEMNPEDRALTRDELKAGLKGADGVVSVLSDVIDAEALDAAGRQLRIVANFAVGYNNFDVAAATERGVVLTNTPGVLDDASATHTMALLLATARRIAEADRFVRSGQWRGWAPTSFIGLDVDGKILGVAGLGRIGKNFARKALGFGMRILYSGHHPDHEFEAETGARLVRKDILLAEADFLSLHVPLTAETHHYIGAAELRAMKSTAVLINTSRGPVIDEKALVQALREKWIWGAGLDVFEEEPALAPGLAELENVVLAPHMASATRQTRVRMGQIAAANIIKVLNGRSPDTCVNPEVLSR